jgi:excisionase family DNA binding protein
MKSPTPAGFLSTAQVAESLGVSVSTVKRWVEDDILPAHKTAGGHRKLLLADVLDLARRNNLPLPNPGLGKGRPKKPRTVDTSEVAETLYKRLLEGDTTEVRRIVHDSFNNGVPIDKLADEIIGPAMHHIGSDWERGRIDVLHEHRATQVCLGVLHELKTTIQNRVRRERPVAVGGAIEGDSSELPTLLAQMVLIDAGWDAVNLGPNTPLASFGRALTELRPQFMWISFSHVAGEARFRREYAAFYRQADKLRVPVIIGGKALTDSLRSAIPYSAYGDGLANLAAFARTLYRAPDRPKRGRPKR